MSFDPLRYAYLVECTDLMESYCASFSQAAQRGNAASCRVYFDAIRAVARDLDKTLRELEEAEKDSAA